MLMKFGYALFFALTSISGVDAFLAPATRQIELSVLKAAGSVPDNEDFLNALKGGSGTLDGNDSTGEEEVSSGSSRFKEMMEASKGANEATPSGRSIQNPFLNTAASPQSSALDNLSVEQQAEMFRQMMAGAAPAAAAAAAPPVKQKRTDDAGRPVGRNRDADSIANTADVYFAQLKRDSTVRTLARYAGDEEVADAVMQDEGIKELESLIHTNPYLKGQQDEERKLFDGVPDEALRPFLGGDELDAEAKSTSGISYKEVLKQRRMKKSGGVQSAPSSPVQSEPVVAKKEPELAVEEPVPQQVTPEPPAAELQPQPVVQPEEPVKVVEEQIAVAEPQTPLSPEETRQKVRTFMGLLLKHRGGPGFGKGLLKGPEIDRFENLLNEITTMLRSESMEAAPQDVPMMTSPVPEAAIQTPISEAPVAPDDSHTPTSASSTVDLSQIDSAIACIEGAATMYKNSPPALRESILVPLRGALVSAVDICGQATGVNEPTDYGVSQPGTATISAIDGVLACIEGALTMYKNSPPALKKDVVVALRAALVSAVSTCNNVIGDSSESAPATAAVAPAELASPPPSPAVESPTTMATPEVVAPPVQTLEAEPDANTKALQEIYDKIKSSSGNGSLGLRSDLTSTEASSLADDLVQMRSILMGELDAGIPDPGTSIPDTLPVKASPSVEAESSSTSKYQQMLAKARAEKATKA